MVSLFRGRGSHRGKNSWEDHYPTYIFIFKGPQDAGKGIMVDRGLEVSSVAGGPAGARGVMTAELESCGLPISGGMGHAG